MNISTINRKVVNEQNFKGLNVKEWDDGTVVVELHPFAVSWMLGSFLNGLPLEGIKVGNKKIYVHMSKECERAIIEEYGAKVTR